MSRRWRRLSGRRKKSSFGAWRWWGDQRPEPAPADPLRAPGHDPPDNGDDFGVTEARGVAVPDLKAMLGEKVTGNRVLVREVGGEHGAERGFLAAGHRILAVEEEADGHERDAVGRGGENDEENGVELLAHRHGPRSVADDDEETGGSGTAQSGHEIRGAWLCGPECLIEYLDGFFIAGVDGGGVALRGENVVSLAPDGF